ncbi:hypothetical protein [Metapseudomonas otitidis]|uniref:hypothetical protein n=1 Tax=Metapseudomonas otitidis TaxID=319939 RepID=UPI001AB01954|nr:hypothetical protein [Pseudomonas otitidis]MBO2927581.1 hypothetical protein [Pseudomonas otitidis]
MVSEKEFTFTLDPQLVNPLTTMKLAGALLEEYAPDVEVTVKKPSPTPSAWPRTAWAN